MQSLADDPDFASLRDDPESFVTFSAILTKGSTRDPPDEEVEP
jgi:hypothetical protein